MQEGVGDHRHQGVPVKTGPGSSLEVVQTEFFLELLMGLLADPAGFDGSGNLLDRYVGRQVRKVVFPFPVRAMLAHQPDFFAGHMLRTRRAYPLWRTVGDAHAHGGKARDQTAFGPRRQLT